MTILRVALAIGGSLMVLLAVSVPQPRSLEPQQRKARSPLCRIGSTLRSRAGLPANTAADLKWGRSVAALSLALVHPALPMLTILWIWTGPLLAARRAATIATELAWKAVPEVADVLSLAVRAGANLPSAFEEIARRVPGVGGATFATVAAQLRIGVRMAEVLDLIPTMLGGPSESLVSTLRSCVSGGTEMVPALERIADELRQRHHQLRLERARRIPVLLLFPLVTCTLPAFALLTVIPLLSSSLNKIGG